MVSERMGHADRKQREIIDQASLIKEHLRDETASEEVPQNVFLPVVDATSEALVNYVGAAETARRVQRQASLETTVYDLDDGRSRAVELNDRGTEMVAVARDRVDRFRQRALASPYEATPDLGDILNGIDDRVRASLVDVDAKPDDVAEMSEVVTAQLRALSEGGIDGLADEVQGLLEVVDERRSLGAGDDLGYRGNLSPLSVVFVGVAAAAGGWYAYKCVLKEDDGRCENRYNTATLIVSTATLVATIA
jgi:hypothetical protein